MSFVRLILWLNENSVRTWAVSKGLMLINTKTSIEKIIVREAWDVCWWTLSDCKITGTMITLSGLELSVKGKNWSIPEWETARLVKIAAMNQSETASSVALVNSTCGGPAVQVQPQAIKWSISVRTGKMLFKSYVFLLKPFPRQF